MLHGLSIIIEKNHLGNIREVWRAAYVRAGGTNIVGNTDQRTQYYTSGLLWAEGLSPTVQQRKFNGKEYALYYIFAFKNSDGSFNVTIKIIPHSMGAAYAKGFIKVLVEGGFPLDQIKFEADFAPFQPIKQKAFKGVYTVQFSHPNDKILLGNL